MLSRFTKKGTILSSNIADQCLFCLCLAKFLKSASLTLFTITWKAITYLKQDLDHDLSKISEWAYQWKMSFNPDPSKQAVEVYFTRKLDPPNPPTLFFNNSAITIADSQKHLGLILDKKLAFGHHLKDKLSKANKGIGLINRLRKFLPRDSLLTIYKAFVRPHLDYGDIIYDHPGNASFSQNLSLSSITHVLL